MIPPAVEATILRLYEVEKWQVGTIAHQLSVRHSVVERVIGKAGSARVQLQRPSMIDPFVRFIKETLKESTPTSAPAGSTRWCASAVIRVARITSGT